MTNAGQESGMASNAPARATSSGLVSLLYVVSLAFFLLVCIVQTLFPIWHFEPVDENRRPTPFGRYLDHLLRSEEQLPASLNAWFDDQFGFRSPFIRIFNEAQYRVFGTSSRVHIGSDGFLFEKNHWLAEIENSRKADILSGNILSNIRDWSTYLTKRGIKLVLVPMPSKTDFYGAYLPASAPRPPGPLLAHQLRSRLKAEEGWIYIDADAAIRAAVARGIPGPAYYRTDPHMNFWGALAVAQEIVRVIAADAHKISPPWHQFEVEELFSFPGGYDQRALGLLQPILERLNTPRDLGMIGAETEAGRWLLEDKSHDLDNKRRSTRFEYFYHARGDRLRSALPPILLYGDSFADHLATVRMHEQFLAVYRSRQLSRPLAEVMQHIP